MKAEKNKSVARTIETECLFESMSNQYEYHTELIKDDYKIIGEITLAVNSKTGEATAQTKAMSKEITHIVAEIVVSNEMGIVRGHGASRINTNRVATKIMIVDGEKKKVLAFGTITINGEIRSSSISKTY